MAPITPTNLPPIPAGRAQSPAPARREGTFPAPASAPPPGPKPQAPASPARTDAARDPFPAARNADGSGEARQRFTLQTLSTFAGLVVGASDAAAPRPGPVSPAAPSSAQARETSPQRPLRPGSQIDIKV